MRAILTAASSTVWSQISAEASNNALDTWIAPTRAVEDQLHAVLIEQHGTTVAEHYYKGEDRIVGDFWAHETVFGPDVLHDVRSISKGVVALLVGVALMRGQLDSLDTPALDLLPERALNLAPTKRHITVRHLLTMTAGLDWREDGAVSLFSDETLMEFSSDMVGYALGRKVAEAPGRRYLYNSGCVIVLGAILEQVTGMRLVQFARQALFDPLGVTDLEWRCSRGGQVMAHAGLRLRARDLAKLGRLALAGGLWQDQRIVPQAYMDQCLQGHVRAENSWQYGYHWRVGDVVLPHRKWRWAAAMGNGGQRLYIVPALDLVVVIMAGRYNQPYPRNAQASDTLFERIVGEIERPASP